MLLYQSDRNSQLCVHYFEKLKYPGSGSGTLIRNVCGFGDLPSQKAEVYLGSDRHKKVLKNMPIFKLLQKRLTFAHNIFVEAYLARQIKKITQSRFLLKLNVPSLSRILWNLLAGI